MEQPLLDVQHVEIRYNGMPVVQDVSFQVQPGEILGIVGESGSGKSTLIRGIMGLLENTGTVTRGNIYYKGKNVLEARGEELRSLRGPQMGMIFQNTEASLCPVRTIEEQLYESVMEHEERPGSRALRREVKDRALELFSKMGLTDGERILKSYPFELSGGMRQRVMIAMALITKPEILIADEPTTALDVTVQKQVLDLIRKLQQDMGTSVILITHDLGVVRQYADRINVMYAGRIVESALARELLEHPRHAYTRALMKSIPGLHAKGSPLYTIPGLPPNMMQEPCGCSFRPRNTLGNPELCLTDREPELVEISPGHSVQNCPGCLAGNQ